MSTAHVTATHMSTTHMSTTHVAAAAVSTTAMSAAAPVSMRSQGERAKAAECADQAEYCRIMHASIHERNSPGRRQSLFERYDFPWETDSTLACYLHCSRLAAPPPKQTKKQSSETPKAGR
jgi:hypothetical protein